MWVVMETPLHVVGVVAVVTQNTVQCCFSAQHKRLSTNSKFSTCSDKWKEMFIHLCVYNDDDDDGYNNNN